jgi:mono/diheme cytochrome c family protein
MNTRVIQIYCTAAALAALAATVLTASPRAMAADSASAVERGKYLVNTSGCHDCHTPFKLGPNGPEPDMSRALSGHPEGLVMPPAPALPLPWGMTSSATNTAHAGPWGVSFTANLTPDGDTGLGQWTLKDFVSTIRTGRHMGRGRPVLPPMPIPVYNHFTDADLAAMYAYLRTVPPIKNRVPEPLPPTQKTAGH